MPGAESLGDQPLLWCICWLRLHLPCPGCPEGLLAVTGLAALQALPEWARKTLQKHASDPRPHFKTDEQLEKGTTGDAMWDACQHQLVLTGQLPSVPPICT